MKKEIYRQDEGPELVLPALLQYEALKNPAKWRWVNLIALAYILEKRNVLFMDTDLFALGNTRADGSVACVVQHDDRLMLRRLSAVEVNAWWQLSLRDKTQMPGVHAVFVPAGFAVNVLRALLPGLVAGQTRNFLSQSHEEPEVDPNGDNCMTVAQHSQSTFPGITGNLVNIHVLLNTKRQNRPADADMWRIGFGNRSDAESLILSGVIRVIDGHLRTGFDEWETLYHWETREWTAQQFHDLLGDPDGKHGVNLFVPAFWAARVQKNAPVGTGRNYFDPTRMVPVGPDPRTAKS